MDDLNAILGIVIAISMLTLFTVYWLNGRVAHAQIDTRLRSKPQRGDCYESNDTTVAPRCRRPS